MTGNPCPGQVKLAAYIQGQCSISETLIEDHLEICGACERAVQALESELTKQWVAKIRIPSKAIYVDESECKQAIEIARHAAGLRGAVPLHRRKPEVQMVREYRLLGELGAGGMGVVYKALHTRLNRVVALKLLREDRTWDPRSVARFEREMQSLGRLDHPNIVGASDAGEHDGRFFLVMEYVNGRDLASILRQYGRLSIADASELIRQAAGGLQHASERGLVHRDLKPHNLMLATDGTVKIVDMGLALLDPRWCPATATDLTSANWIMGTLDYMAPEQASDIHHVDIRADIYSLGATLFHLLTGEIPLPPKSMDHPLKRISQLTSERPRSIGQVRPDLPPQLAGLVDRMLSKSPANRPAKPAEVAAALVPTSQGHRLANLLSSPGSSSQKHKAREHPEDAIAGLRDRNLKTVHVPSRNSNRMESGGLRNFFLPLFAVSVASLLMVGSNSNPRANRHETNRPSIFHTSHVERPFGAASLDCESEANRNVAEAVLAIGGQVDIEHWNQTKKVSQARDLPEDSFDVSWISLTNNSRVSADLLATFMQLKHLTGIALQHTGITDSDTRNLARIDSLVMLYLYGCPITDEGMVPITQKPNLQELILSETQITNETIERLKHQKNLRWLYLKGTQITDAGLKAIGAVPSLQRLDLRETDITDHGLTHLLALKHLEELDVGSTQISDVGLQPLAGLTKLKKLCVAQTNTTNDGIQQLQANLPLCRIFRSD